MLTDAEVARFRTDGVVILRGLLEPAEVGLLRSEVEDALGDVFGVRFGHNTRTEVLADGEIAAEGNFLPLMSRRSPFSLGLVADDERLSSIADQLLGSAVPVSPALATCMVSDTPWHKDGGIGAAWVRFNAYLVPVRRYTGALRIVPGSQRELDAAVGDGDGVDVSDYVALETDPGDVIVFDPRARHASFGGRRRVRWCVDFAAMPAPDDLDRMRQTKELVEELSSWPHPPSWPAWRDWAADSSHPRRAATIARLSRLGVSLDD